MARQTGHGQSCNLAHTDLIMVAERRTLSFPFFTERHRVFFYGFLQGCNLAHILGLYKMTGKSGLAFSLSATGSIADVVLWAIARLQMRMYASATFQR